MAQAEMLANNRAAKQQQENTDTGMQIADLLETWKSQLTAPVQDTLKPLLQAASNETKDSTALRRLQLFWYGQKNLAASAYYEQQIAQQYPSAHTHTQAGKAAYDAFTLQGDSTTRPALVDMALQSFEKSLVLEPENSENKINFALCLIEGKNAVMPGVLKLREVVEKDSMNVRANLVLGRLAVMSGQMDKALLRFQTAIGGDANNSEAYYYLGDTYAKLGKREEAMAAFEKCRALIKDPAFDKELDNYIKTLFNNK